MPEGHSLLKAANEWNSIAGVPLALSSPQGRFANEAKALNGSTLIEAKAHGKHLFLNFGVDKIVHIHLGLYGKHWVRAYPAPAPVGAVRLRAEGSRGTMDLSGPTACELLTELEAAAIIARLGPDPLQLELPPKSFLKFVSTSKTPIGKLLMEQDKIAGIGNFYRAELLFFHRISPYSEAKALSELQWIELWKLTRRLMLLGAELTSYTRSIAPGWERPQTVSETLVIPAERTAYVYKCENTSCLGCGNKIEAEPFYGRVLYLCRTCQVI